jgi:hypothetical protein
MAAYSFIDNINDFFSTGYFTEDFQKKVFDKSGYSQEGIKELCTRFSALRQQYNRYKQAVTSRYAREKDKERETFDFNSKLLECLGYYKATVKEQPTAILSLPIGENGAQQDVPVRIVCNRTDGSPQLYVMDIPTLVSASDDTDAETGFAELGLDRLVTHIFSLPEQEHPRYILMSSGNMVFFMDADKWERGAYLRFDIERLLVETTQSAMRNYFALFYLLVSREALAAIGDTPLMQQLEEESYKNAYVVTQDLKRGVVAAVEALANEAIWYIKHTPDNKFHDQDETDDNFETMMRDDCLVFIYRLLFIFYAESRPDLDILPINDQTYQRGYSLEMLRDLEQVNLITAEELNGYFFDHSIKRLFALILRGYNEDRVDASSMTASFRVRHIDSPLFSDTKLKVLVGVKFRNVVWQSIVCQLSLSQKQKGKPRGRISYANLGINQLGSVYENLLAYRGFYAEEDYIEVHPKGDLVETYLQPRSRRDVFEEDEILKDEEGHDIIHPRGKFIYRLNGRDRKKSASFYTPEVLTKSTVKYTLKPIVEKLECGEIKASDLLQMKILEPAMGAAAFQNEVINQLAVLYLQFRKQEVGETIDPLQYPNELQKVKAFIATSNVYGVDLNATAIELGKLSLWLNVMHKDMEVPFFSNRLAEGNAVIGAWLKVYKKSDVVRTTVGQRAYDKKWWEAPTHRIHFSDSRLERHYTEVYHFLLPVQDMLGILNAKLPTFSKEEEQKLKEKKKVMANIRKSWLNGITGEEYKQLERISRKIDVLLKKYVEFQMGVAEYANNGYAVWKYAGKRTLPFETNAQREEFDDQRYRKDSAYMKLKAVMDYWCSLFFWEYKDLVDLPTRQEYWDDIERILNVEVKAASPKVRFSNAGKTGEEDLFLPKQGRIDFDAEEEESAAKVQSLEYYLAEMGNKQTNKLQLEGAYSERRFDIVKELAKRYHFFHPMLEFLEVFWLRDGFDIICGNPPWEKWSYEQQEVIGEKYPEVLIREDSATDVEHALEMYFQNATIKSMCMMEQVEATCSATFMNSFACYPLLVGQQADLYKNVLTNCFDLLSEKGYLGMLHPESVYDDAKGQPLRKVMYRRLQYHFQYQNALNLFPIAHRRKYSANIYTGLKDEISFDSISNLFHPKTVDDCYMHNGQGICEGIKGKNGKWNLAGHKNRIVHYNAKYIKLLSDTFEDGRYPDCAKLVSVHNNEMLGILDKISNYSMKVTSVKYFITECLHETGAPTAGLIKDVRSHTCYPRLDNCEMIYNAPQFYVSNPIYQTPKEVSLKKGDFNIVDLEKISDDYIQRTKYLPLVENYRSLSAFNAFVIGQDENGSDVYDSLLDHYKVGFRKMVNLSGERSLICAVLPRRTAHIHGVISISFLDRNYTVDMAALCSSIVMDFYWKTIATQNITESRLATFPFGIKKKFKSAMYSRTLMLNCLNKYYDDLWSGCWCESFRTDSWSLEDARLKPFSELTPSWNHDTPLRNHFERRQALVEIDVLAAMSFGLSLEDLEFIYDIQFPVLRQNEDDTWYDQKGNVVYSVSLCKKGVGVDRATWNTIRGEQLSDNIYQGATSSYIHTVPVEKSELYGGEQVTYYAPYTRCDRIADYQRAWTFFEERFKNED